MDVSLDRREDHDSFRGGIHFVHILFQVGHCGLHHFRRLEHERQLHLSAPEEFADHLHAVEKDRIDDLERRMGLAGFLKIGLKPHLISVDDAVLEPFLNCQPLDNFLLFLPALCRIVRHQVLQRVGHRPLLWFPPLQDVFKCPFVEHDLPAELPPLFVDFVEGHDSRSMDDRHIETRLDGVVEEDAVERMAHGRRKAERDIADSEECLHPGEFLLDQTDRLDRLDACAAKFFITRSECKGEGIEDEIMRLHPVPAHDQVVDPLCNGELLLRRFCHSLLIDGEGDDCRTVPPAQRDHPLDPFLPILQVDRIDDRLAADELQGVFDNRRLRGVDHDRECDLRVEPRDDLPHVLRLIAADVRGAHIDHVRPFF